MLDKSKNITANAETSEDLDLFINSYSAAFTSDRGLRKG